MDTFLSSLQNICKKHYQNLRPETIFAGNIFVTFCAAFDTDSMHKN